MGLTESGDSVTQTRSAFIEAAKNKRPFCTEQDGRLDT